MRFRATLVLAFALLILPLPLHAGNETEIRLWTTETPPERQAVIRYLADAFMALHPGIRVNVVCVDENQFAHRVEEAAKTEAAPTLVNTNGDFIVALGAQGFVDTTMATAFVRRMGEASFSKGPLRLFSTGSSGYYGVPYCGWVQGLWYRADWFKLAGLKPPKTWGAMLKAAKRFTDTKAGTYGILVGTMADSYAEQVFTQIALSNGARMFAPDGTLIFDSPAMVEALRFYLTLAGYTPPGPQTWRGRDYYFQNRLAMFFYSTYIMDDLALSGVAADSLGTSHFKDLDGAAFDPELARNTQMIGAVRHERISGYGSVSGFAFFRCSPEEQEAAQRFLSFLFEPGPYVEWLHMSPGGMLPVVKSIADTEAFMHDPGGIFRRFGRLKIKRILSGLNNMETFASVDGHHFPLASVFYAEKVIPRMIAKALDEGVSPEAAVAWAESEMRRVAADLEKEAPSP